MHWPRVQCAGCIPVWSCSYSRLYTAQVCELFNYHPLYYWRWHRSRTEILDLCLFFRRRGDRTWKFLHPLKRERHGSFPPCRRAERRRQHNQWPTWMPTLRLTCSIMKSIARQNRAGAKTHPCLTPEVVMNGMERRPARRTLQWRTLQCAGR